MAILLYKKNTNEWYHTYHLYTIQLLAFITAEISVAAFVWYLFYAAYYHIRECTCIRVIASQLLTPVCFLAAMMPVETSAVVTSVWAGMTAKWALFLWLFARRCVIQLRVDDELE